MVEKLLGTIPEATSASGLGRTSIYKLINEGRLDSVTYGKRRLIVWESLRKLAASLKSEAA